MRIKMTEAKFSIGDPVWSKMKGYCPWPSRIASPLESNLKNDKSKTPKVHYLVYFFGSNNFAWMPEDTIKPYEDFKDKNKNGSKTLQFKQGLKAVEEYIEKGGKASLEIVTSGAAIKNSTNNDNPSSPSGLDDSVSNDASNIDGDLPSIDDEIAAINNKKPAPSATHVKKSKKSADSHNDSSSLTSPAPSSQQKDYSRTPFKSRKSARGDELATETASPTKRVKINDDDSSLSSPTISKAIATSKPPTSKYGAKNVLLRVGQYSDSLTTDVPKVNLSSISVKSRTIKPPNLKFGFIGLGFMGQRILKNLLNSGHSITIWNRTSGKCNNFIEAGASQAKTPGDVVQAVDIVFSCLSDPKASKEIVFGPFGILSEMDAGKGYVELSSIDPTTSNDIGEAITTKGGRYLEAPLITNGYQVTENGDATIVAAGDKNLYQDCLSCFQATGKKAFYLGGAPGLASKMNLIFSMLIGNIVGAFAESASLLQRSLSAEGPTDPMKDFRDILRLSVLNCPLVDIVCEKLSSNSQAPEIPLNHLQKDLRLALEMSDEYDQMLPITATTNEQFKNAKKYGYGEQDASCIYLRSRYNLS